MFTIYTYFFAFCFFCFCCALLLLVSFSPPTLCCVLFGHSDQKYRRLICNNPHAIFPISLAFTFEPPTSSHLCSGYSYMLCCTGGRGRGEGLFFVVPVPPVVVVVVVVPRRSAANRPIISQSNTHLVSKGWSNTCLNSPCSQSPTRNILLPHCVSYTPIPRLMLASVANTLPM